MTVTYKWDIQTVDIIPEHNGLENVVYRVVWKCTASTDDGYSKSTEGVVELDINNIDSDNFSSIEAVSKDTILEWVKQKVWVESIERQLVPKVVTVSFDDSTATTVAEQLALRAVAQAAREITPEIGDE